MGAAGLGAAGAGACGLGAAVAAVAVDDGIPVVEGDDGIELLERLGNPSGHHVHHREIAAGSGVMRIEAGGTLYAFELTGTGSRLIRIDDTTPGAVDATVIEARGRPVTPGFFAGITQLGLVEISLEASSVDSELAIEGLRPEFDVSSAYNPHSSAVPVTRIEGYSWTLTGPSRAGSIVAGQGRPVSLDGSYASFLGGPSSPSIFPIRS